MYSMLHVIHFVQFYNQLQHFKNDITKNQIYIENSSNQLSEAAPQ